jgi:hypothetical protein
MSTDTKEILARIKAAYATVHESPDATQAERNDAREILHPAVPALVKALEQIEDAASVMENEHEYAIAAELRRRISYALYPLQDI